MVAKTTTGGPKVQKTIAKSKDKQTGVIPEGFEIDETARYAGVVDYFNRKGGFGFITLNDKDVVPEDRVMVHWKDLQSEDRWPYMYKGFEVEFGLKKVKPRGSKNEELKAKEVSCPGGAKINLGEEADSKREFVGDQNTRYTGTVKWYNNTNGIGYMKLEDGYDIPEDIPTELRISREELNVAEGSNPRLRDGMDCEFGIVKSAKGTWCVYNVTMPGGDPLSTDTVEQRVKGEKTLTGTVSFWKADSSFGYIKMDDQSELSEDELAKLKAATEKHTKRNKKNDKAECEELLYFHRRDRITPGKMFREDPVKFKVYTDYRGIGAFDVEQVEK